MSWLHPSGPALNAGADEHSQLNQHRCTCRRRNFLFHDGEQYLASGCAFPQALEVQRGQTYTNTRKVFNNHPERGNATRFQIFCGLWPSSFYLGDGVAATLSQTCNTMRPSTISIPQTLHNTTNTHDLHDLPHIALSSFRKLKTIRKSSFGVVWE